MTCWDVFVGNTMKRTIFVSKNGFIKYSGRPAAWLYKKSHLLQFGKGDIKGNVYILLGGDEFTLSISDLCGERRTSRKEKYLGGYYDKVKAMLPEGEPDKHYVTFVDFFSDICMDTCIRESTRKNYFRTLDTLGEYAPEAAFCDIDKTFVCGTSAFFVPWEWKPTQLLSIWNIWKGTPPGLPERICQTFHRGIVQPLQCKTGENFQESLTTKELVVLYQFWRTISIRWKKRNGRFFPAFCSRVWQVCATLTFVRWNIRISNGSETSAGFFLPWRNLPEGFIPIEQMFSGKALGIIKLFHRTRENSFICLPMQYATGL